MNIGCKRSILRTWDTDGEILALRVGIAEFGSDSLTKGRMALWMVVLINAALFGFRHPHVPDEGIIGFQISHTIAIRFCSRSRRG
jgi:hypothetical protein